MARDFQRGAALPGHRELARLGPGPRRERLRRALLAFRETYDATWLVERHGFRPPAALGEEQLSPAALAG